MKESKFIELLNLYVDHEINAADAALLEAEIQGDATRRRVYTQYCRMQKACTALSHDFTSQVPAPIGNVVLFPKRRKTARVVAYAGGLLAAAACVAFVFVSRNRVEPSASIPASSFAVQVAAPMKTSIASATLNKRSEDVRPALQTVFAGLVNEAPVVEATVASAERNSLDWMNRVQLQRMPLEDLRFEAQTSLHPDARTYRSRHPLQGQVEMTAFQFQR